MSAAPLTLNLREQRFNQLTQGDIVSPNQEWLACILASWRGGQGALPDYLGLSPQQFKHMQSHFFPRVDLDPQAISGIHLDFSRMLEKEDLATLLKQHAFDDTAEVDWIIAILVAACLGNDHLWKDLGLWSRSQLSAMLSYNFPRLASKNDKDMKWKKFLYKQLCEAEGIYVCRAPSCEVCIDYPKCFVIED